MKERPILFSGPMLRAILAGQKTQTRRAFNDRTRKLMHAAARCGEVSWFMDEGWLGKNDLPYIQQFSPYGQPGDRLFVRETFFAYGRWETRFSAKKGRDEWHFVDMTEECDHAYQYAADNPDVTLAKGRSALLPGWHRRPAIFMPRRAIRIFMEVVAVRVERLNDIGESDAMAEGSREWAGEQETPARDIPSGETHLIYRQLWESINSAGSWEKNPWVWVVEFKRIEPPKNGD